MENNKVTPVKNNIFGRGIRKLARGLRRLTADLVKNPATPNSGDSALQLQIDALQIQVDALKENSAQQKADIDELLNAEYDKYAYDVKFLEIYDYVYGKIAEEKIAGLRPAGKIKLNSEQAAQ
jgi:hypothetical protein